MKIVSLLLVLVSLVVVECARAAQDGGLCGGADDKKDQDQNLQFDPTKDKVIVKYKNQEGKEEAKKKAANADKSFESERFKFVAMEIDERDMLALENDANIESVSLDQERGIIFPSKPLEDGGCDEFYGRGLVQAKAAIEMLQDGGCEAADNIGILDDINGLNKGNVCDNAPYLEQCEHGQEDLILAMVMDKPEETIWIVRNTDNGQVLATGRDYDSSTTDPVVERIPLCIGKPFKFIIVDSGGDGMHQWGRQKAFCCNYKQGAHPELLRPYGSMADSYEMFEMIPRGCPPGQEVVMIDILTDT